MGGRRPGGRVTTFNGFSTPFECQKKCQETEFCDAFVFNKNASPPTCNLKKYNASVDEIQNAEGKTFGRKYCSGNRYIIYFQCYFIQYKIKA